MNGMVLSKLRGWVGLTKPRLAHFSRAYIVITHIDIYLCHSTFYLPQFDRKDPHYDPKASEENPRWYMVDVKYDRPLERFIPLHELKALHEKHKKIALALIKLSIPTDDGIEWILEKRKTAVWSA